MGCGIGDIPVHTPIAMSTDITIVATTPQTNPRMNHSYERSFGLAVNHWIKWQPPYRLINAGKNWDVSLARNAGRTAIGVRPGPRTGATSPRFWQHAVTLTLERGRVYPKHLLDALVAGRE